MGSCMYYLKANDCKRQTVKQIENFIIEGMNAEQFWQNNRGIYDKPKPTAKQFWMDFDYEFPLVSKYLTSIDKFGGDFTNDLAGYLDFGSEEDIENLEFFPDWTDDDGIEYGQIWYSAYVWHMADWTGFMKFLESEFKVKDARWVSEEDVDPFDAL